MLMSPLYFDLRRSKCHSSVGPKQLGSARWTRHGLPQTLPCAAILPGKQHHVPALPDDWHPVPATLLTALHECGRTAARDAARFALHRVQVRGRAGQVVGTDGRTALLWSGFRFPFAEDLLVPAVPAFGCRELAGGDVRLGRTASHLVVEVGPWTVWLPVDKTGRYPDVAGVVPRPGGGTVAGIDERDAAVLLDALPGLPGAGDEDRPVTLDLDGWVAVRARDAESGAVKEVVLTRSPAAGPPARAAIDRKALTRALGLGCHTVRLADDGKPVAFEGDHRTFVTVALDPSLTVAPDPSAARVTTCDRVSPSPPTTERSTPVKPHETNGRPPAGKPAPPPAEQPDPLAEAEALRAALADAAHRAARLVALLRGRKREQRALSQVYSSLKSLNLGP